MDTIAIVDTSICTDNLGDEIIMDAVNALVWSLFPTAYIFRVPSHEALSDRTRNFVRKASYCFIGGTNLLASKIGPSSLWRLRGEEARIYGEANTVCVGTGWNDYTASANRRTSAILREALSSSYLHSTRDSYTRDHLSSIGVKSVVTSCPTTWSLTSEICEAIPTQRAKQAVFTLSAWRANPDVDRAFVTAIKRHYKRVYFFPQMQDDWAYFCSFGWSDIHIVSPTTEGYNRFLENEDVDFIGTRLHGGIRALQKGRRSLILSIDNRAKELGRDTGLPVLPREATQDIELWIEGAQSTRVSLPLENITAWKDQFGRNAPEPEYVLKARYHGERAILLRDAFRNVRRAVFKRR